LFSDNGSLETGEPLVEEQGRVLLKQGNFSCIKSILMMIDENWTHMTQACSSGIVITLRLAKQNGKKKSR